MPPVRPRRLSLLTTKVDDFKWNVKLKFSIVPRFLRSPNFVPLPLSSSRRRRLAASLLPSFVPSVLPLTETNERRKSLTHCEHQRGCKNAGSGV